MVEGCKYNLKTPHRSYLTQILKAEKNSVIFIEKSQKPKMVAPLVNQIPWLPLHPYKIFSSINYELISNPIASDSSYLILCFPLHLQLVQ